MSILESKGQTISFFDEKNFEIALNLFKNYLHYSIILKQAVDCLKNHNLIEYSLIVIHSMNYRNNSIGSTYFVEQVKINLIIFCLVIKEISKLEKDSIDWNKFWKITKILFYFICQNDSNKNTETEILIRMIDDLLLVNENKEIKSINFKNIIEELNLAKEDSKIDLSKKRFKIDSELKMNFIEDNFSKESNQKINSLFELKENFLTKKNDTKKILKE